MDHSTDPGMVRTLLSHPILDAATERALLMRKDESAIAEIVRCNQRLVYDWAWRYAVPSGLEVDDLHQAGNLGLLRAIAKFDVARGTRFSTYATQWIRQAIVRTIAEQSHTIRRPVHVSETRRKIAHMRMRLAHAPTIAECAAMLGRTEVGIQRALNAPETQSLDAPLHPDTPLCLAQLLVDRSAGPDVLAIRATEAAHLHAALASLPTLERDVLRLRFGLDGHGERTLKEVGDSYAKTREWARLVERQALLMLREIIAV
jgi:RNA polymerase sigma factor (sigma-70 family)